MEQITFNGIEYNITDFGLVSELYKNKKHTKQSPPENEVEICIAWLQKYATRRKTVNKRIGSYGLKHVVEKSAGVYVSNGSLILAVYRLGYRVVPIGPENPNAYFDLGFSKFKKRVESSEHKNGLHPHPILSMRTEYRLC
jgi:hypothetical protein